MSKVILFNCTSYANGRDGVSISGCDDITIVGSDTFDNKGNGITIVNNQTLKSDGLNLTLESDEMQELLTELRNTQPEKRQSKVIQKITPYLEPTANIMAIVSSILSLVN